MPRAGTYQTEAIVIKKTKLGEADRILTFYTPDLGKVQAVAKGVRRPRSKLSGHLELLTHSSVLLTRGRNLDTIIGSQAIDCFLPLKSNLELCACALYATELVHQFGVDRQENRRLFRLLLELMQELGQSQPGLSGPSQGAHGAAADGLLRCFEVHLLDAVGYRPQLQWCVACRQALPATGLAFSVASGGAVCPECRPSQSYAFTLSSSSLDMLRSVQDGDWSSARRLVPDPRTRRETELLVRTYLRYLLERDIRSAAWLDVVRQTK
jgi:DNA repair protein RecO (recombination protein O)